MQCPVHIIRLFQVKCNSMRVLGNLLHFLRYGQLARSVFQRPLEEAVQALVQTIQSEATMKVRWNACYALGNAFRNPALPLGKFPTNTIRCGGVVGAKWFGWCQIQPMKSCFHSNALESSGTLFVPKGGNWLCSDSKNRIKTHET